MESPGLCPSYIWYFIGVVFVLLEIEIALRVIQIPQHPFGQPLDQSFVLRHQSGKENYRLRWTMNIYRISAVVIIFRRAVFQKEVVHIKFDALLKTAFIL